MGSECDSFFFFVVVVCLEVTLKSILCQSETPVTKKLLLIALTVRLFVGNWMNCSSCLPTSMKDPGFSFASEGFEGIFMQSHSLSSRQYWFTVAVTNE